MTKMVYGLAAFGVTVALIGAGTVLTRPSPATPTRIAVIYLGT